MKGKEGGREEGIVKALIKFLKRQIQTHFLKKYSPIITFYLSICCQPSYPYMPFLSYPHCYNSSLLCYAPKNNVLKDINIFEIYTISTWMPCVVCFQHACGDMPSSFNSYQFASPTFLQESGNDSLGWSQRLILVMLHCQV